MSIILRLPTGGHFVSGNNSILNLAIFVDVSVKYSMVLLPHSELEINIYLNGKTRA